MMVRGCGCYGVLDLAMAAFKDKTAGWRALRAQRPNYTGTHVRCPVCLRTWHISIQLHGDTLPDGERGRVSGPFKAGE